MLADRVRGDLRAADRLAEASIELAELDIVIIGEIDNRIAQRFKQALRAYQRRRYRTKEFKENG